MSDLRFAEERGYSPGDRIQFIRPDGRVVEDVIRCFSTHMVCVEPYARNWEQDQVILTYHSWTTFESITKKV